MPAAPGLPEATLSRCRGWRWRRNPAVAAQDRRNMGSAFAAIAAPRNDGGVLLSAAVVADGDEGEALGRGGRAAGAAVAGLERPRDVVGPPAAEPDQLQRPDHVAHLVVEER